MGQQVGNFWDRNFTVTHSPTTRLRHAALRLLAALGLPALRAGPRGGPPAPPKTDFYLGYICMLLRNRCCCVTEID